MRFCIYRKNNQLKDKKFLITLFIVLSLLIFSISLIIYGDFELKEGVFIFGIFTLISFILIFIQWFITSDNMAYTDFPITLLSFGHFAISLEIFLILEYYFFISPFALIIALSIAIGFEIFEYICLKKGIATKITSESRLNRIIDVILDSIGIFLGFIFF